MTDILKNLIVSGDTKIEVVNETHSVELSGRIKMIRGNFIQESSYLGRTYTNRYGYIDIDELDGEDISFKLGDVPIDSLDKLKKSLTDAGLSALASKLGFTYDEFKQAALQCMQTHKMFISCFGKKSKLWSVMSTEEQTKVKLKYFIDNYDTNKVSDSDKKGFGIVILNEDGSVNSNAVPTKEQLMEKLATL